MRPLVAGLLLVAACGGGASAGGAGGETGAAATPEIESLCAAPLGGGTVHNPYAPDAGAVAEPSIPCHAFADFVAACDTAAESDSGATLQAACFALAPDGGRVLTSDSPLPAIESRTCPSTLGLSPSVDVATVRMCCCY